MDDQHTAETALLGPFPDHVRHVVDLLEAIAADDVGNFIDRAIPNLLSLSDYVDEYVQNYIRVELTWGLDWEAIAQVSGLTAEQARARWVHLEGQLPRPVVNGPWPEPVA